MRFNPKLAQLLSDFFLDIAKAFFIATFVTPSLSQSSQLLLTLTRGLVNVILFLLIAWQLAEVGESK